MDAKYHMTQEQNVFVAKRLLVDSVYKSANLEGIAATYADTVDILNNVNVARLRPDDITAILNLRSAWHYVLDHLNGDFTLGFLQECHVRVGHGIIYPLGELRNCSVSISGTAWRPEPPDGERYHTELQEIKSIADATQRSITLMLWIMRSEMFLDGNKRVATIAANHQMVQNGCGVISVPIDLDGVFKTKLVRFYETNDSEDLQQFIYDNCIDGMDFSPVHELKIEHSSIEP